jgi:prefoldin subunit 5
MARNQLKTLRRKYARLNRKTACLRHKLRKLEEARELIRDEIEQLVTSNRREKKDNT